MYGNTPPPPGGLLVPGGVLATTGVDGLSAVGIVLVSLGLIVSGAFVARSAYLKRQESTI